MVVQRQRATRVQLVSSTAEVSLMHSIHGTTGGTHSYQRASAKVGFISSTPQHITYNLSILITDDTDDRMNAHVEDVKVPMLLQEGTPLTKVSAKKKKTVMFRIDPDQGYVLWDSKKSGLSV